MIQIYATLFKCGSYIYISHLPHTISREMQTLKSLVPGFVLLWIPWQSSCRLGCKHFRVVVHGLLQVPARFLFFPSLLGIISKCTDLITSYLVPPRKLTEFFTRPGQIIILPHFCLKGVYMAMPLTR